MGNQSSQESNPAGNQRAAACEVKYEYCTKTAIATLSDRISKLPPDSKLAVVVLPGALNPCHTQHVRSLELARRALEKQGVRVVMGFLQPSSDAYLRRKVGAEFAIALEDRVHMCEVSLTECSRTV